MRSKKKKKLSRVLAFETEVSQTPIIDPSIAKNIRNVSRKKRAL